MVDKSTGEQRAAENRKDQTEGSTEAEPKGHPTSNRYKTETAHAKPDDAGVKQQNAK